MRQRCQLLSIAPTFYEQLFHTKAFLAAFLFLNFRFVLFWGKEISAKVAHKMLVKLSTVPIFTSLALMKKVYFSKQNQFSGFFLPSSLVIRSKLNCGSSWELMVKKRLDVVVVGIKDVVDRKKTNNSSDQKKQNIYMQFLRERHEINKLNNDIQKWRKNTLKPIKPTNGSDMSID